MDTAASTASIKSASDHRLCLPPVSDDGVPRPLWSVMIPTWNCANYLRETLASVLAQAPGLELMQIEVVDDCSTKDDPEVVVRELGQGRVTFHRQPQNVGHTRNFESCLQRSRGHLIHLLHGDDAVRPEFYATMGQVFAKHPEIGAAFSRYLLINEQGNWTYVSPLELPGSGLIPDLIERLAVAQIIQTPSMVVRREVYEKLGGFDRRLSWTEDWEMWARIAVNYPVWHEVEPLALYRVHGKSNSGTYTRTGENVRDMDRVFQMLESYVPGGKGRSLVKRGRSHYALAAMVVARRELRSGNLSGAVAQARGALRLSPTPRILLHSIHLVWVAAKELVKKLIGRR